MPWVVSKIWCQKWDLETEAFKSRRVKKQDFTLRKYGRTNGSIIYASLNEIDTYDMWNEVYTEWNEVNINNIIGGKNVI